MDQSGELAFKRKIDSICNNFEEAWSETDQSDFESYLNKVEQSQRDQLLRLLLEVDVELRSKAGQQVDPNQFQHLGDEAVHIVRRLVDKSLDQTRDFETGVAQSSDTLNLLPETDENATQSVPKQIGRYRIDKVLGKGGFGLVYLAFDDQLDRPVAVKVPHKRLVSQPEDAKAYLTEARTVANLDHPNIVPVHDVGQTEEYPCFVVSKYIEGTDLSDKIKNEKRLTYQEVVELVATVAEALHYAHKQGLVHRDVKPGNILLGNDGRAYVVDFGLALKEQDIGKGPEYAGTPAYMSPEQARGEGHRVDGRSDIYSLGAVLYELLVGRKTFGATTQAELLQQITTLEVKPPRQIDDNVPKELERVCLKALSKRASDRYTAALDMADDLRNFLKSETAESLAKSSIQASPPSGSDSTKLGTESDTPKFDSDSRTIKVVPKGLRSFDAHDADFFLELLPGPRDRDGLPDSIRFWKTRIEEPDPDNTFSVGLIYGPSGCGKSSLVKAGLLPRITDEVIRAYVEATPDETETRLLHGLRKHFSALDESKDLSETLTALRKGQGIPAGKKVLIVLDQFEQWLHAKKEGDNTELVQALRHCDGGRVQCIVMVRDDFWMAATRFMRELEVRLLEAQNSTAVDLFPVQHAEKVLSAFGRAFGALPENTKETSSEQKDFIKQSVAGLAEEGKVICVRLALFAEMMKGRAWTPDALKKVGGTEGVGVTFLEETFAASTAPPERRLHQKAARAVLKALLPESGSDIKGEMKSYDELLKASGYSNRPLEFDDLIRILDGEIRLITPTEQEGLDNDEDTRTHAQAGQKYYQLTHDYLVPLLRDWLTRKQRESRRGRAELRLIERSTHWNSKPEIRNLPWLPEWVRIRTLTKKKNWTLLQRKMMGKAAAYHLIVYGISLLMGISYLIFNYQRRISERNRTLNDQIRTAVASLNTSRGIILPPLENFDKFPDEMVLAELRGRFGDPVILTSINRAIVRTQSGNDFKKGDDQDTRQLALAFALAHYGDVRVKFLISQIEGASSYETDNFVSAFRRSQTEAVEAIDFAAKNAIESSILRAIGKKALSSTDTEGVRDSPGINSVSNRTWRLKARLAIIALHLKSPKLAQDMCLQRSDPVQRTVFIKEFSEWSGALEPLAKVVVDTENPALRSGICLAVGSVAKPSLASKNAWQPILRDWHAKATDSGTHSAAGWALSQWNLDIPEVPETKTYTDDREWWHAPGIRFVKITAGNLTRDVGPVVVVKRDYWLSDCEITVGLYKQFMADEEYHREHTDFKPDSWKGTSMFENDDSPDLPVQRVGWYEAVIFCNWLSWKMDLEPCYAFTKSKPPKRDAGQKQDQKGGRPERNESYQVTWNRNADGIRLPTEHEWVYSCCAETTTRFSFGDNESWLVDYGWFAINSTARTHQVRSKLCNAWGLFDMHGNVCEWCWMERYPETPFYFGGGWRDFAVDCQSTSCNYRTADVTQYWSDLQGFRVAVGPWSQASESGSEGR